MTNITHPALLQADNEKLRGLLREAHDTIRNLADDLDEEEFQATIDQLAEIELALAQQQTEPCQAQNGPCPGDGVGECKHCPTAVDMATAAAQGFRDGQAAMEPAPAKDEREAVKQAIAEALGDALDCTRVWSAWSYGTMRQDDFQLVAEDDGRLDEIADAAISAMTTRPAQTEQQSAQDEREAFEAWMVEVEGARIRPRFGRVTAGPFADEYRDGQIQGAWNVWQARAVRPAHTEQQPAIVKHSLTVEPVAYAVFADNGNVVCFSTQRDHPSLVALEADGHSVVSLAPIAQTSLPTQGAVEQ